MAYSETIKNKIKERLVVGETVKQISEETGISQSTIYKWKKEKEIIKQNDDITHEKIDKEQKETSKRIKELIKLKKFDEAVRLTKKYPLNAVIQSQMITIAIKEGNFEEAKRIGKQKEFINSKLIQSQMITIAIKEGEFEEAKRIGKRKEFINNEVIQSQMVKLNPEAKILNLIANKLYYGKIEKEDIEEIERCTEISEFQRNIMLLAIYEKQNNVAKAKILVKNYKKENEKSENNKTFNIIMQRIASKKKAIFDYEFYQNLLHWNKDAELEDKYDQEKRIEEENNLELTLQRQQEIENIRKKQEAINTRRDKGKGRENNGKATREIRRETNTNTLKKARQNFEKEIKVELNHIKQPRIKPERQINYFDGVMKYLKEKKHLIYAKMQSNNGEIQREGISQWDKMDRLIQKVQDNKDNKLYLSELYNKILLLQENGIER